MRAPSMARWSISGAAKSYCLASWQRAAFFYADSDDIASVSEMTNVEMVIEVWDNDTYETLASYDVTLN